MALLLQLMLAGVWASTVIIHTRRLFRLACVAQLRRWEDRRVRSGLNRLWWWLGQDEFWDGVRLDSLRAIELSTMIAIVAWSVSV